MTEKVECTTGLSYFPFWTKLFSFLDKFLCLYYLETYIFPDSYLATMDDYSNENSCLLQSIHNLKLYTILTIVI